MRPLVLDTGPLLTYLTLRYLDSPSAERASRREVLRDVCGESWDQNQQDRFRTFLTNHQRRLTTGHVIAEVLHLREQSRLKRYQKQFLPVALAEMTFLKEKQAPLNELDRELILRFGLTDAGLIYIAQEESAIILTDDQKLFQAFYRDPIFEIMLTKHCLE